jgi:hypothetical protein
MNLERGARSMRSALPEGVIKGLAKFSLPLTIRSVFVWDFFDSFFSVSYLTRRRLPVNGAEREEIPRFAILR